MERINGFAKNVEKFILIALLGFMVVLGMLQIISRFIIKSPIAWSEGLLIYMFIWSSYLGASLAVAENAHFKVEIFTDRMPRKVQKGLEIFVNVLMFSFACLIAVKGSVLVIANQKQMMALLPFSMSWPYLALPVSCIFMAIHTLNNINFLLKGRE